MLDRAETKATIKKLHVVPIRTPLLTPLLTAPLQTYLGALVS